MNNSDIRVLTADGKQESDVNNDIRVLTDDEALELSGGTTAWSHTCHFPTYRPYSG